jgi:two-component system, OmpR family, alkaline phosphatase synthesis response regulator PhoP
MGLFDLIKKAPTPQNVAQPKFVILVADDEMDIREVYSDLLTEEGYKVITAKDGQEAVSQAYYNRPDLILLDIRMPVIDGIDVLKKLKTYPQTNQIPVLILTNAGTTGNMQLAKKNYADSFIIKANMSPPEIVEKVKFSLAGKTPSSPLASVEQPISANK